MPPVWLVPMLQKMMKEEEEEAFWHRLYLEMGGELEVGPLHPKVQLEEVGWWVLWGPELEPVQEGMPLSPLGPGPIEVDGAKQVPEDGAMVEDTAEE